MVVITVRKWGISGMALAAIGGMAFAFLDADSSDRHVEVVNKSRLAITGLAVSVDGLDDHDGSAIGDDDILGPNVLPPGYHVRINLDDGSGRCRFDFKVRLSDGRIVATHDFDVCSHGAYNVTG